METPEEVLRRIRQDFGASAPFVAEWLSAEMADVQPGARAGLMETVLLLAGGNLDRLGAAVDELKQTLEKGRSERTSLGGAVPQPPVSAKRVAFPEDIVERIRQDYGHKAPAVADWLSAEMHDVSENIRIARCILFGAKGDLDELAHLLRAAQLDYRDVILWTEYADSWATEPERIFDFTKPFTQHVLKAPPEENR